MGRKRPLRVSWSDAWSDELDQALERLPEMETCPHDLYRTLARTPSPVRKRFALVTDDRSPIAAIALRQRHRHWELMCTGAVPSGSAPAVPGRLWEAIEALGVYVRIFQWDGPAPDSRAVRFTERTPKYVVSTRIDLDEFWSNKGNRDWLRKARRRTEALGDVELEVDGPGAARWTIDGWRRKWDGDPMNETDATPEILAAAEYFERGGLYRAFRLLIDGTPVAGVNAFVHDTTLVMTQSHRDPAYDRAGVGVHLDERIFRWLADSPYEAVDLGCGEGYKARWGVEAGSRVTFGIAPAHLSLARAGLGVIRGLAGRTRSFGRDISQIRRPAAGRNKNLTTPFRTSVETNARTSEGTNEGADATASRRTRGQGPLTSSDTSERSRGVHT